MGNWIRRIDFFKVNIFLAFGATLIFSIVGKKQKIL